MPLSMLFWVLMLLWVLAAAYSGYITAPAGRLPLLGGSLLLFLLLLIVGLRIFGGPIQG